MNSSSLALACGLCLCANSALASPTRSFVLDSASVLSEGKLDGASVESDGSITSSITLRRTELKDAAAKSLLVLDDGSAYVGSASEGKIFQYRDGTLRLFAETKQVMVASLARGADGTLYAGTLPKGKIFAISKTGQVKEFASPAGAEHIWALLFDDKRQTLFAATGPEGKLFAIDAHGKAEVYYDSDDAHIMALARDRDGNLYAGTSDRALLVRLRGVNRAEVLYDFEGNEVTALALRDGDIAVAANQFTKTTPPKPPSPTPSGDQNSPASSTAQPASPLPDRAQTGKGQLYRVGRDGRVQRLFTADEGHLTTVEWAADGSIYAGTGKEGHVHRVRPDRTHALFIDVDERQVLATHLNSGKALLLTGDGAAVYELEANANKHEWSSAALDAGQIARFGQLTWRSKGAVTLTTRSGNTDKPDAAWSDWSPPLTAAGAIASPPARFLQVRVQLPAAGSVVYAIEAFYLPQNQPALISEVTVEPPRPRSDKPGAKPGSVGGSYKLRWKVDNADNDALRYRLYYAAEKATAWRPLLRDSELLTATEYNWDTEGVPDGYYRIRVEASDEFDNAEPLVEKTLAESEPVLIDNHPPHLPELRAQPDRITGKARDGFGPIAKLEYRVDALEWKVLSPDDRLFDTREESFTLPFALLPKGSHTVAVRASDARGNSSTAELEVVVP